MEEIELGIKAIFFDLDDTLHDHLLPFSKAFKSTFPIYDEQVHLESLYKKFRDYSDLLWTDHSKSELTLEELRVRRIVLALESFNIRITNEAASEFQKQYDMRLNNLQLFQEVPELLGTMKNNGYKIGIITNGPIEHQFNKIKSLGLTQYIKREWIFISDEVGLAKPNPQVFSHVAQEVKILPSELLYIGDSWTNDVVAPSEAGWQSIWYNHRKRLPSTNHKPAAEIHRLSLVSNTLNNLN